MKLTKRSENKSSVNERKTMAEIGSARGSKNYNKNFSLRLFARHNAIKGDENYKKTMRELRTQCKCRRNLIQTNLRRELEKEMSRFLNTWIIMFQQF